MCRCVPGKTRCAIVSNFDRVARVPAEADNVAIATRRLEAGTSVADGGGEFRLPHTILEGHRFVRVPVEQGARLTSWGLPFGVATRALEPGEYVCNERILDGIGGTRHRLRAARSRQLRGHYRDLRAG